MTDAELTRAIAVAGAVLGVLALSLNWRQYRVQGRIGVRIAFDSRAHLVSHSERYAELAVSFSNPSGGRSAFSAPASRSIGGVGGSHLTAGIASSSMAAAPT
jgi:hypothetical protein